MPQIFLGNKVIFRRNPNGFQGKSTPFRERDALRLRFEGLKQALGHAYNERHFRIFPNSKQMQGKKSVSGEKDGEFDDSNTLTSLFESRQIAPCPANKFAPIRHFPDFKQTLGYADRFSARLDRDPTETVLEIPF